MGPEESVEKVKLYMMVDGQPTEIAPEIAEIKLPEESSETQAVIADAMERLKSREMEMCREAMREELDRVAEIAKSTVPDEEEVVTKTSVIVAQKAGVTLEEAVGMILKEIRFLGMG